MRVTLTALEGPNAGQVVVFDAHDTFVVGRSKRTSAQLPEKDPFLSRYHFLIEINPPLCRVVDLDSHNGTFVNGAKVATADLADGDSLKAGHTVFAVGVEPDPEPVASFDNETTSVRSAAAAAAIPGFRILRELGRGGMGVVYEAIREADESAVALKAIRPVAPPTRETVARFLREVDVLRQLYHPNIVRLIDTGEEHGRLWFAMEYVPGIDASRWVKENGPMPVAAAVEVANALLDALRYAHGQGFVHRDVKPGNVFLVPRSGGEFDVKLGDFGLARAYDESRLSGLTLTGENGGTPAFMAPEQIFDFRNAGPPADIYSTAATLYYLLTGKFIFDLPESTAAAFGMMLSEEPVPIRTRRADVPAALADAIHAALVKEPGERTLEL